MRCGIYPSQIIPSSQQPEWDDIVCIRPKLEPGVFFIAVFCFFVKTWKYWNLGWHTAGSPFQRGGKRGLNPNIQILFCPNSSCKFPVLGFFLFWCFNAFKILKFWRWGIQNIFNVLKMRDRAQRLLLSTRGVAWSQPTAQVCLVTPMKATLSSLGRWHKNKAMPEGLGAPPTGLRQSLTNQLSPWPKGCSKVTSSLSYVQKKF